MVGLIVNISLYVWSLLNYFIELFRGSPFVPLDVLSFGTGLSVSDGYTYELSWKLILGSIMFFLIYLVNKKSVNIKPKKLKFKLLAKLAPAAYIAVVVISLFLRIMLQISDTNRISGISPEAITVQVPSLISV